jgi:uncharacterized protein (DUF433 family)
VYLGLLATAAVVDMPVGTPLPFASVLEPSSRAHANNRGTVWLAVATSAVGEPLASHDHNESKGGPSTRSEVSGNTWRSVEQRTRFRREASAFAPAHHEEVRSLAEPIEAMAFTRISVDPGRCGGVPCIRDLRIPVATVISMVAEGQTHDEILHEFPELELDDIREALRFAAEAVRERELPLLSRSS